MKLFNIGKKDVPAKKEPRSGDRRTKASDTFTGKDRRKSADRRGLTIGLKFKTSKAIGPIEDWLDEQFPENYHFSIEAMSEDLYIKEVKVVFETTEQRDRFKAFLSDYIKSG